MRTGSVGGTLTPVLPTPTERRAPGDLLRRTLLAGGALLLLAGCGGGDDDTADRPAPATELTVELDAEGSGDVVTATLTCDPAGGDVADPRAACDQLAAMGVAGFAPVGSDVVCTQQFGGPQTATVTGTLDGEAVDATFSRTDGCEISRWDALDAVLQPAG